MTWRRKVEAGRLDPAVLRSRVDALLVGGCVASTPRVLRAERVGSIAIFGELVSGRFQQEWRDTRRVLERDAEDASWHQRVGDAVEDFLGGGIPFDFDWRAHIAGLRALDTAIPGEGAWTEADTEALAKAHAEHPEWVTSPVVVMKLRETDAVEALARVALAACEHRARNGAWPGSADDLAPLFPDGVPVDPYTEEHFVFLPEGEDLVIEARPPGEPSSQELREDGLSWWLKPSR